MSVAFSFFPRPLRWQQHDQFHSFFTDPRRALSLLATAEHAGFGGVIIDDVAGMLANLDLATCLAPDVPGLALVPTHWAGVMAPQVAAQEIATLHRITGGRVMLRVALDQAGKRVEIARPLVP